MQRTVYPTRSLAASLQGLNKDELHIIRRTLDVKGASQLNKPELVRCLEVQIMEKLEQILSYQDLPRYQLIQRVIEAGGALKLDEWFAAEFFEPDYFQDHGLLFIDWNDRFVYIPLEIKEKLLRVDQVWLRQTIRRNSEWTRLTTGLLFYYGAVRIDTMLDLLSRYIEKPDFLTYHKVIRDFADFDLGVNLHDLTLSYYTVLEPEQVLQEHEMRPQIDYYPFKKEQLLQAAEEDYIDRTPQFRELLIFMRQHWLMELDEADMIIRELHEHIQNGAMLGDLIEYMQAEIELRDLHQIKLLTDRLVQYMDHTRRWDLKGYTPAEVGQKFGSNKGAKAYAAKDEKGEVYDFQSRKKVGRNDPCPCGSGKKFKKCCGK